MNIDEKKEYLSKYRIFAAKLKRIKEMSEIFPSEKEKFDRKYAEVKTEREKMECEIDSVDGGVLSEILSQKYICGKSIEEIALLIGYCKRQTERLHIKALKNFCTA